MISMKDFEDKEGKVNWATYHKAQEDAGERCPRCSTWMSTLFVKNPIKHLCSECQDIQDSKEETSHSSYIRCPKCKESWEPSDSEDYECYEDGDHDVCCGHCGHDFSISTSVSYNFTSPELIEETDVKD